MERELLILGILRQHSMHGYQLVEFIDHNMGASTDLTRPTAYFLLDKMTRAGWVAYEETQAGRRPMRRVYHLTPAGELAFQRLLRENLAGYRLHTFPDDVGVAFLDALPHDEAAALLAEREQAILALQIELSAVPEHSGPAQLALEHQIRHLQAELDWVRELMDRINRAGNTRLD